MMGDGSSSVIQVFVATFNRPEYLRMQLESLVAQTLRPQSITVLDDGPNPETRRVAELFSASGVGYVHTSRAGLWGNVYEAQQRVASPYVAIFHDDDQTHPRYLEIANRVIKANPGVTLVGCDSFALPPDSKVPFEDDVDARGWLFDARDFASFFFNGHFGHFPFFIYKAENFKGLDVYRYLDYNGPYGKHGDSAFVPLSVGTGKAAMLSSRLANYGCHPGQAVCDPKSLPDAKCWARVEAVFHKLMGDELNTFAGFSYAFRNYRRLRSGYRRRGTHDYSFDEYMRFADEEGAVSPHMGVLRPFCNHMTEKALRRVYRRLIRSTEEALA